MTKAEVRALEKYPIVDGKMWTSAFGKFEFDRNYSERQAFQEGYEQAEKDLSPKWHKATGHPKPDTEVLAEVKGFEHNRFAVLKWTKEGWWQHIPRMNDIMPSDGWIGAQGLFVIRWAYIEDRPQE